MTMQGFAVVPDPGGRPVAVFVDLEQAMEWGLVTFGSGRFRIERFDALPISSDERRARGATGLS
jgi:hypothetical protein